MKSDRDDAGTGRSDNQYRLLIDSITDYAIYMLDRQGHVVSWNPGARRFKGYEPDEIIGRHFSSFYTPGDQAAGIPARALAQAEHEGRFEQEGWRVRKDGTRFWAHVVIDPIRAPDGELLGFAKITRDLTERREAEEALRRSEEQFRLLVQSVTDYAIYMLDPEGRVSSWNPGAERIKGYSQAEILGQHFSRFYTDEDRAAGLPETALRTASVEGRFEREGWRVRKDGGRFWAHVVIDAIRDDRGEIIGFAKVTRDITERVEAQKALDETREALFHAQKLEAIGQLTGGVAHDFNNLLMAVIGSLDLVLKRLPPDPRITPLLHNALQGAQRGAVLTQRMLAFARKQELKLEAVDVPTLVAGMKPFIERSIGASVGVEVRLPRRLPMVQTDPYQFETALLNLAVNARDAMPDGGSIVVTGDSCTVGSDHPVLAAGEYVRVSVTDTGEGMDAGTLARASEPFFTTKGVGKGTGLGLSMVDGLAHQSGGQVTIDSRPGEGTTVTLWLPVADTTQAAPPVGDTSEAPDGGAARLRILAVDDDGLVLLNTAAMLEDLGHQVVTADSGHAALEALAMGPAFDLVVTDHVMPGMSGLQLAEAIRRRYADLPVLLATGYAELKREEAATLPRLSKPFTQADLARHVLLATERRPTGA